MAKPKQAATPSPQVTTQANRTAVSGSRSQADDVVADAPAYRRDHPDHRRARDPADRRRARHANHPRRPAHDDAPAAHHHVLDPAHCPAAQADLARRGPPRHDASRRDQDPGRRRGHCPCHPTRGMAKDVALAPMSGGHRARPPRRRPAQAGHDELAPRPGPCSAAPADHARHCPVQARRPARHHHHAGHVPSPACWDAPRGWGRVPATTGTYRSRRQRRS